MNTERIKLLREYIKETPEDPFSRYALALELTSDEPDEATEILLTLLKDAPSYLPSYYQLSILLIDQNRIEEAKIAIDNGIQVARQQNNHKTIRELKALGEELD